jgi:hypothetical protein
VSEDVWQLLLIGVGVLLEGGGIALVVLDVREARSQARAVVRKGQIIRPLGIAHERDIARPGTVIGGKQPSVDERVARLERQLPELREEMEGRIHQMTETVRGDLAGLVSGTAADAEQRDTQLREFLGNQLDAGIGRRVLGALLFGLGLLLQTVANVIGIL